MWLVWIENKCVGFEWTDGNWEIPFFDLPTHLNGLTMASQEAVCSKWKDAVVVSQLNSALFEIFDVLSAADARHEGGAAVHVGGAAVQWPEALVEAHSKFTLAVCSNRMPNILNPLVFFLDQGGTHSSSCPLGTKQVPSPLHCTLVASLIVYFIVYLPSGP